MAISEIRETILGYLKMIADPYERQKESPEEIFCMWFSDLYFPSFNSKSFHPGVFEQGVKQFEASFSHDELAALRVFNEYFDSIHNIDLNKTFEDIQKDPHWIKLGEEAKRALAAFEKR